MSRGQAETDQLRGRLESQLDRLNPPLNIQYIYNIALRNLHPAVFQFCNDFHRLLEQLSDLEKDREDLGEEEYAEMRQDTLEQVFRALL